GPVPGGPHHLLPARDARHLPLLLFPEVRRGECLRLRSCRLRAAVRRDRAAGGALATGAAAADADRRLRGADRGPRGRESAPSRIPRPRLGARLPRFPSRQSPGLLGQPLASAAAGLWPLGRAVAALRASSAAALRCLTAGAE